MDKINKIQGALVAGAIGDALGFIIEKNSLESIINFCNQLSTHNTYSIPFRTYPEDYEFGQYSDDTQFTKLLAISYLESKSFKSLLVDEYKKRNLIGLGKGTKNLLKFYSKNSIEAPLDMRNNISNGALMRAWVIGLLFSDFNKIKEESEKQSKLTHDTMESVSSCIFISQVMNLILENPKFSNKDIVDMCPLEISSLLKEALNCKDENELRSLLIYKPLEKEWQGVPPLAIPTLIGALVTFLNYKNSSLKELLLKTYLLGGDTDSTGSIAGALWGCHNGLNLIDNQFRGIVHDNGQYKEDYLIDLASSISSFRS